MMLDALGASQLSMDVDQIKLQAISNNIANLNTPAFKKQFVEQARFNDWLHPSIQEAQAQLHQETLTTQGSLLQTDNPQDLAITDAGYFQVQGDDGVYYTRRGDFHLNSQGELVTASGERLLGISGVIHVDKNTFTVDHQGRIFVDNQQIDTVPIVQFKNSESLHYQGNGLYKSNELPLTNTGSSRILQGFIEQANTKSIDEMLALVSTSRHFEASQRVLRTADNLLSTAINHLGESNV